MASLRHTRLLTALAAAGLLCAHAHAGLLGTSEEKKIGRQVADKLEKEYGLAKEGSKARRVRTAGEKVAVFAKADRPKIDYTFNVLADKQINAVAAPGGYIYAFRGLVRVMDTEELLAAVLAHECAHVSERHGMQALERALGWSLLLGLATGGGSSDLGNIALNLIMRGYSRGQEAEADKVGHVYLFKAGYDVGAMARMLERLHESSEEGGGGPSFLRTHPSGENRIRAAVTREADILLELGHERPADDPPRLAIVHQASEDETEDDTDIGEALAKQVSDVLNGSAQYHTEFAGSRVTKKRERVSALGEVAADLGLDGAVGLSFSEPPIRTEGTGRKAKTTIKLAVDMRVVAANATEPELTYSVATKAEKRDADEKKMIAKATEALTAEAARSVAVVLLRPPPEEEESEE